MPPKTKSSGEMTPEKLQQLVNKRWPGAMSFADDERFVIRRLPTGILALDAKLGGGLPRGRHVEFFGGYNVGKTAATFRTIARTQADGGRASFIDVEGTFESEFAEKQGVDLANLPLTDQNTLEHGHRVVDYVEMQLRSGLYDVIVVDSIAALLPKGEFDSSMEDASMGTEQARLMSKALRKLTAANRNTCLIFINQTRESVNASAFAKRSITSGGKAMGFYAGTRLEFVRTENIKRKGPKQNISNNNLTKGDLVKGHRLLVRVEKDKTGGAVNMSETTLVYDYDLGGFDPVEDLIYLGREHGLIKKSGSLTYWLTDYPDDKVSGRGRLKAMLRRDRALAEELQEAIELRAYNSDEVELDDDAEEDDEDLS